MRSRDLPSASVRKYPPMIDEALRFICFCRPLLQIRNFNLDLIMGSSGLDEISLKHMESYMNHFGLRVSLTAVELWVSSIAANHLISRDRNS